MESTRALHLQQVAHMNWLGVKLKLPCHQLGVVHDVINQGEQVPGKRKLSVASKHKLVHMCSTQKGG